MPVIWDMWDEPDGFHILFYPVIETDEEKAQKEEKKKFEANRDVVREICDACCLFKTEKQIRWGKLLTACSSANDDYIRGRLQEQGFFRRVFGGIPVDHVEPKIRLANAWEVKKYAP